MNSCQPAFLLILFISGLTFAQPPAAPPRNVDDILAVLSQYKPDPVAVEKLRAEAVAEPPTTTDRQALAIFHHQRARTNESLGRHTQLVADLNKALEYVVVGARAAGDGVGNRDRLILDLLHAEASGGNLLRAAELAKQPSKDVGVLLSASYGLTGIYVLLGDIPAARQAVRDVDESADRLRKGKAWKSWGNIWQKFLERAHARLLEAEGNYVEAERHLRLGLALDQLSYNELSSWARDPNGSAKSRVLYHWAYADTLLAKNMRQQGRVAESEYYARSSLIKQLQAFGRYSTFTAMSIGELGWTVYESGRFTEAAALARAAIDSYEQAGVGAAATGLAESRALLGSSLVARGLWPEAVKVFEERDIALSSDPVQYAKYSGIDSNWGLALLQTGNSAKGLPMLEAIYRNRLKNGLTENEYFTAEARGFYAMGLAAAGQNDKALVEFRGAVKALLDEGRRHAGGEEGGAIARQLRLVWIVEAYMKLLANLRDSPILTNAGIDAVGESFILADVARGSSVQRALSESAARATPREPALADLARREQDARQRFSTISDLLNRLLSAPPGQQLPNVISALKRDIVDVRSTHGRLKADIASRFPDYAELVDPKPAALAQVQAALGVDDALISIYVGADTTYVWAVPKRGKPAFARVDLGGTEVGLRVTHLRKALEIDNPNNVPAFDLAASHDLYQRLLQPVASGWEDAKHIVVVPHKALGQLPFGLLTTAPATSAPTGYRQVPWLIRRAAVSQLPSVSSLLALRRVPVSPAGRQEFIGFGDPLFSNAMALAANPSAIARGAGLRNLSILKVAASRASLSDSLGATPATPVANSSGLAQLARLEDTAEEIESIAKALNADPAKDVYLRKAASKKNVKSGLLNNRRIVMFATHGLAAGDLDGLSEPALALSAPEVTGNADEDGLLTMGEVLGLKLNADWVVLSACNTAAGSGVGTEAVSGLGKAFFYAGARSLLVTNWPVETVSARLLTTRLFEYQAANPATSRAEALRVTMLDLLERSVPAPATGTATYPYAHPLFWAPFSLVGDGGR